MTILDRLCRAWLLRRSAEWRSETCGTCAFFGEQYYTARHACNVRRTPSYTAKRAFVLPTEPACTAWRRKETQNEP